MIMGDNDRETQNPAIPRVLSIAGSDSGGGAGIQADLKTFLALGAYGMTAVTAVTVQDTLGVRGVHPVPPDVVAAQVEAVAADIGVDAVKTGMLWSAGTVRAVADAIRRLGLPNLVVDPVLAAEAGGAAVPEADRAPTFGLAARRRLAPEAAGRLLAPDAVGPLKDALLPLATVVTPNVSEAALLAGMEVAALRDMEEAARRIHALGPRWVVVKGGHLPAAAEGDAVDLLFDGRGVTLLRGPRLAAPHTHGTGCTFSAALAAGLARGLDVPEAARRAKEFVARTIAAGLALGRGKGPVNHRCDWTST